jgi:uncharacterized membrane protein YkvA (DUF1232 family)
MTDDPFPRARLAATLHRLPAYLRLAFGVAKDPALAKIRRMTLVAAAGYLISPLDIVPDAIPVVGQLDDLAVALAALRFALAGLDPQRRRRHLAAAGLTDAELADDLVMLRDVMAWSVRVGARTATRAVRQGSRLATTGAGVASSAANGAARVSPALRLSPGMIREAAGAGAAHVSPTKIREAAGAGAAHVSPTRIRQAAGSGAAHVSPTKIREAAAPIGRFAVAARARARR